MAKMDAKSRKQPFEHETILNDQALTFNSSCLIRVC